MEAVVFNLGCKVNQYECDGIKEALEERGYVVYQELRYADIYVINTCAVTNEAERKSRQCVCRCKKFNPNCKIFICGCASQKAPDSFVKDNVVYICGTGKKQAIIENLENGERKIEIADIPKTFEENAIFKAERTRAFVKIQDGCNNFCSYCIIPYLRGRSRSRSIENIVSEVKTLAKSTAEIVLTGINLMEYGEDIGTNLVELIKALKDVDVRIRLGSFYVEAMTEELLQALFSLKKFCPHFHLSLQSGDDAVLKRMNRKYTTEQYREKINLIREAENVSVTTDVIVGFPEESDEEFLNTYEFIKDIEFADIHVFPFSAREGTVAYKLHKVPSQKVKERKEKLLSLKKELNEKYLEKNIGQKQSVLFEEYVDGYSHGYSEKYIKVYKEGNYVNQVLDVYPTKKYLDGLI